jgi:dihydrofolate reductase
MIYLIVATDPNGVIGKDNTIPWHCSEDLKLFKKRTVGGSVIMGSNTWKSLPKKPLPDRKNYVLTRSLTWFDDTRVVWCSSLTDAVKHASEETENVFIIGGEQIYKEALNQNVVDRIILSKLKKEYDGNRYFKVPKDWVEYQRDSYEEFDVIYFVKG